MLRKKQHTQLIYAQQKSGNVSLLNIAIKKVGDLLSKTWYKCLFVAELNLNRPCLGITPVLSVLALLLACAGERKAYSDRSYPSRLLCCSIMQPNYNPRFAWTYFIVIWKKYDRMLCIYLQGNLDQTQSSCELCWKPHGHSDTRLVLYWQCQT